MFLLDEESPSFSSAFVATREAPPLLRLTLLPPSCKPARASAPQHLSKFPKSATTDTPRRSSASRNSVEDAQVAEDEESSGISR